eukprot:jgi/Mesen1/10135/ME000076S09645
MAAVTLSLNRHVAQSCSERLSILLTISDATVNTDYVIKGHRRCNAVWPRPRINQSMKSLRQTEGLKGRLKESSCEGALTSVVFRATQLKERFTLMSKNVEQCKFVPWSSNSNAVALTEEGSQFFPSSSTEANEQLLHAQRIPDERFSKEDFEAFLLKMQEQICREAAEADGSGKEFGTDKYGITRVLEGGDLLEKAAANVSIVRGHLSETRAKAMSARGRGVEAGATYFAGALSLVFHTRHPHVPTFRSDVRYFEVEGQQGWFGGGADLTPNYLNEEDARTFHAFYRRICDAYEPSLYARCKALCDRYFYIPSRKEHRGIGGIFFDDLSSFSSSEGGGNMGGAGNAGGAGNGANLPICHASTGGNTSSASSSSLGDEEREGGQGDVGAGGEAAVPGGGGLDRAYAFVRQVAQGFMPSFLPMAAARREMAYGERERQWQLVRRGRYLEFNLLYDRGVRFGLDGGRVESIMVSAPPLIAWKYNVVPEEGSPEAALLDVLKHPREHWAA